MSDLSFSLLTSTMKFLIIVGTAREGRNTIDVANHVDREFKAQDHETFFYDLKQKNIPALGNRTYRDGEEPVPEDVKQLSSYVKKADAVVIVSPEYNHSVPGVLKNALDYLYPEYDKKPFSYVTVSAGGFGGVRALGHLHDITHGLGGVIGPDLPVSNVNSVFDESGELEDESYAERFEGFVEEAAEFVENQG